MSEIKITKVADINSSLIINEQTKNKLTLTKNTKNTKNIKNTKNTKNIKKTKQERQLEKLKLAHKQIEDKKIQQEEKHLLKLEKEELEAIQLVECKVKEEELVQKQFEEVAIKLINETKQKKIISRIICAAKEKDLDTIYKLKDEVNNINIKFELNSLVYQSSTIDAVGRNLIQLLGLPTSINEEKHICLVKELIVMKCDVNNADSSGDTILHNLTGAKISDSYYEIYISNKNRLIRYVKFLLEQKADPNIINENNETPLLKSLDKDSYRHLSPYNIYLPFGILYDTLINVTNDKNIVSLFSDDNCCRNMLNTVLSKMLTIYYQKNVILLLLII